MAASPLAGKPATKDMLIDITKLQRDYFDQRLIKALHNDARAQFNAELITADLETLKGAIQCRPAKFGGIEITERRESQLRSCCGAGLSPL